MTDCLGNGPVELGMRIAHHASAPGQIEGQDLVLSSNALLDKRLQRALGKETIAIEFAIQRVNAHQTRQGASRGMCIRRRELGHAPFLGASSAR